MQSFTPIILFFITSSLPLLASSTTVPSFPLQPDTQICHLDLSDELFGGVNQACAGDTLDRSRCCPVLAAWLFAAHARSALELPPSPPPASAGDLPMMPDDDSQKCVETLQESLKNRSVLIPQPNASCDAITCFCGIRLHRISSLSCPAAFNFSGGSSHGGGLVPTSAVVNLEKNCQNSSYAGCTKCLSSLQKLKGKNKEKDERGRKMLKRDCQLMGLTWLLRKNKTAYIPTVSAVLRAIMYSAHPHQSKCSPDQENMPLAVDSLQLEKDHASYHPVKLFWILVLNIVVTIVLIISV
ncbi:hypothetical protein HN51_019487 [Arachis hypogaea]|uniref:Uncharacterized GPI-anchored protein At4g28100 n=2 Tax=Arachis TaxID=3817 RepID=A0A6P4C205_ARADU|nr:uncharacterized GPI-anchored protein At4g28100 [Arachis duranensis]XP_025614405.1 uncharacterized GPI-anchored protein At4g28100 [Arachis hypogaea]XP_052112390.1 uncharacterized GPI-anchored protein At4g28100-like [Arachis duranensis]XP_057727596.1 uncharacterized GPI-anchored protein At4g28100-like [Arachis stenosperma]QHO31259.1 putative GPI-anchored protein [Arachis hypogaea]RYR43280.1 hypothetical protein Ahy_A08g039705 [Arachis hypogaea]